MKDFYECPFCGEDVAVERYDTEPVRCQCGVKLVLDEDADFVNGRWINQTKLIMFKVGEKLN